METWTLPHTFEFEGRPVKYNIEGTGEALILVHGTPWSSFNLRHLIRGFSLHYTVYYFDLLGYGESDQSTGDVSLGIQNKLLGALIQHWQLKAPLIVGHDFGGTTVLRSHLLDKQDYRKIAVIDPGDLLFSNILNNMKPPLLACLIIFMLRLLRLISKQRPINH